MPESRLRIVVTGMMAQYPLGGITWDYVQYVAGLARLGHEVYYLEDTGQWPYDPNKEALVKDCSANLDCLADALGRFGLRESWAYRSPYYERWFGLSDERRREVVASADLVLNVSGMLQHPASYRPARLVYLDTDPVFTQIKLARGQADLAAIVDAHDVHFSYAENPEHAMPETGHRWRPIRKPIVLSEWHPKPPSRQVFTTVMNWTSYKDVEFGGRRYGQKDTEMKRFIDLPASVNVKLELAIASGKTRRTPKELLAYKGWNVVDPQSTCADMDGYRNYIESSMAEWSVAKHGYVEGKCGWFSERSACYLAAGKPVVAQDTGYGATLPTGKGLVAFHDLDSARDGIESVLADYDGHAAAARQIAEDYFDSDKLLSRLLEQALSSDA